MNTALKLYNKGLNGKKKCRWLCRAMRKASGILKTVGVLIGSPVLAGIGAAIGLAANSIYERQELKIMPSSKNIGSNNFINTNIIEPYINNLFYAGKIKRNTSNILLPITLQDEIKLDNWLDKSFNPYLNGVLKKFKNISISNNDNISFTKFYNTVLEMVGYLVSQANYNFDNGNMNLSYNGVLTQNEFIYEQVKMFLDILNKNAENLGKKVEIISLNKTISTEKFKDLGFESPKTINITYQKVITLDNIDVKQIDTENVDPVENTENVVEENKSKTNTLYKVMAGVGLGILVTKIINKK